jgi:uncharacterized protein
VDLIFTRLLRQSRASGKLVADAYHPALAIEHGCELLTADGGFGRFSGLRWRRPLAQESLAPAARGRGADGS